MGELIFRHFGPPPPPHPPPHLPQKLKKVGFKWGGGSRGSGPKTRWGMRLLDKISILQGVAIQSLEVWYANRPKKAQKGGVCGVFPNIRVCVALI